VIEYSDKMQSKDADARITAFPNLLLGIDSGAMVYLLITHYNLGGVQLPAKLPFTIPPPHQELSFGWQVSVLAVCVAAILIIHAIGLWQHQSQRYRLMAKWTAMLVLVATLTAIGTSGYEIVKSPGLLKDVEQKQKPNE
jgi:hypothetical protein